MRVLFAALLAALLASSYGAGPAAGQGTQTGRQKIDLSKLGPQVGQHVPAFSLPDQNGRVRTLQSIMGPRGAMIVFVRSADW